MKTFTATQRTVYLGLFIAITIILARYVNVQIKIITFHGFPIILSGIIFGPVSGAIVGGLSDILGYFLNSFGKLYHPGFTLTSALTGFIPAMFLLPFNKDMKMPSLWYLTLAIFTGQFITKILLMPYFYSQMAGKNFLIIKMLEGSFSQMIHVPLYAFLIYKILKAFRLRNESF
ncbi:MAG: folate family ECF transporter S component [Candidatus Eremiobacterota bacterium]